MTPDELQKIAYDCLTNPAENNRMDAEVAKVVLQLWCVYEAASYALGYCDSRHQYIDDLKLALAELERV